MTDLIHRFNNNLAKIKPSPIRAFDEHVSQIEGIIKLTLGAPDFHTPEHVKNAGIQAIQNNQTSYLSTPGDNRLRQAASRFVQEKYHLDYHWENEVIVTVGATEALATAFQAVINPGDKVLISSPYFTLYQTMIYLAGGIPVEIDTSNNEFIMSAEMLEEALLTHGDDVKAVILNYPSNPTGIVWSDEDAKAFADVIRNYPVFVISDEIYSELIYEGEHVSIAKYLRDQTIVVNGVSKSHAMTGWRIGLLFAPKALMNELVKVHQNLVTTAPTMSQLAAREALENGINDAEPMRVEYQKRRDYIYDAMTALDFEIVKPSGAFYIFAKIPADFKDNSYNFCVDIAEKARIAIVPGTAFGANGEGYIRISYAASMENIQEAMRRLTEYCEKRRQA